MKSNNNKQTNKIDLFENDDDYDDDEMILELYFFSSSEYSGVSGTYGDKKSFLLLLLLNVHIIIITPININNSNDSFFVVVEVLKTPFINIIAMSSSKSTTNLYWINDPN